MSDTNNKESREMENMQPQEVSGIKKTIGKVLFVVVLLILIALVVFASDALIDWVIGLFS